MQSPTMDDLDFDNYWNQEGAFEDAIDDLQNYYESQAGYGDHTDDFDIDFDDPMV